jgi:hypothetical protein
MSRKTISGLNLLIASTPSFIDEQDASTKAFELKYLSIKHSRYSLAFCSSSMIMQRIMAQI